MLKRSLLSILALVVGVHLLFARQFDCAQWMADMVSRVDSECDTLARNILCYGNVTLDVTPRDPQTPIQFAVPGDTVEVSAIENIKLSGMNPLVPEWGIGMMRVQAALEHTLAGQTVTFVLFGDVSVDGVNQSEPPMRAFYLQTGVGAPSCHQAPESGVLIQTPAGAGYLDFSINNARLFFGGRPPSLEQAQMPDVTVPTTTLDNNLQVTVDVDESDSPTTTVLITAAPGKAMTVLLIEGMASVRVGSQETVLVPGTQAVLPMDDDGELIGDIVPAVVTDPGMMDVPIELLPDPVQQPDLTTVDEPTVIEALVELPELVGAVVSSLGTTVTGVTDSVVGLVDNTVDSLLNTVDSVLDTVVDDVVAPVIDLVPSVVAPVVELVPTVVAPVVELVPTVVAPVVELVPTVVAPVVEIVPTVVNVVPTVVNVVPTVVNVVPTVVNVVPTVVNVVPTVVNVVPTVVNVVPTVVAPVTGLLPTVVSIIPTNLPILGGLLNP